MTAAVAAAAAAVLVGVLAFTAVRLASARSERRFQVVLGQIDAHMSAISRSLERAVERSEHVRERGVGELGLTLDLQELLDRIAEEATSRTGAEAAAIRVRGPGESTVAGASGTEAGDRLLDGTLVPPGSPPFRALTLSWAYEADEAESTAFRSALVVPIAEEGVETGALVAYSRGTGAFHVEQARALEALADEVAPGLGNARRFAEAELRAVTDALTGVRNRRGYDEELEREVGRARRTGRPLSLLLLDLDDFSEVNRRFDYPGGDLVLREFGDLLARTARVTDTVCRRGGEEFAIVLPETGGDEGRRLYERLRELVAVTVFTHVGRVTFSAGLVERDADESAESMDARASAGVNRAKAAGKNRLEIG